MSTLRPIGDCNVHLWDQRLNPMFWLTDRTLAARPDRQLRLAGGTRPPCPRPVRPTYLTRDPLAIRGLSRRGLAITLVPRLLAGKLPGIRTLRLAGHVPRRRLHGSPPRAAPGQPRWRSSRRWRRPVAGRVG